MSLNEAMNLVLPIKEVAGGEVVAYHTPISREVFEANFKVLAATKSAIASKGPYYQMDSGPVVAALTLKDEAAQEAALLGDVDSDGHPNIGAARALLEDIKRQTLILCPTPQGWKELPVDMAIGGGFIDASDWSEAESAIVFFTCHFALARKAQKERVAAATAGILKASITPLSSSAWIASLQESTPEKVSPAQESFVPS
ncbi:hypothetical protein [Robbsia andropogonis]|uniref:hypothetical protein n=1 Tax=Robbsia andropogonis TaxID=28092 RepID=UPI002A6B3F32|nr:hypothetical protein [Robbsia andropogonis]